jgi:hypothetical protein
MNSIFDCHMCKDDTKNREVFHKIRIHTLSILDQNFWLKKVQTNDFKATVDCSQLSLEPIEEQL